MKSEFAANRGSRDSGTSYRGLVSVAGTVVLLVVGVVLLAQGCGSAGASGDRSLSLGYIEWDENVANSTLMKVLAEDELGYEVELEKGYLNDVFEDVSDGEVDAFLDVWLPAHQQVIDEVGGNVVLSEEPWYVGETEFGIAVPDYMEDTRSVEDLNDSGAGMITGIEPNSLLMIRIQDEVIPQYDLDLALVEASTPVMLTELERAYRQERPFVFLAWSPHWMNVNYDFHYLEDPKNTMNDIVSPSKLHNAYREGLAEEDPVAFALMDSMRLNKAQTSEIELMINDSKDPEEAVRAWVAENPDVVDPWLDAATAAGGMG